MEKRDILGLSFIVVVLLIFLAVGNFTETLTGSAVDNIPDCRDTDAKVSTIKGFVTGSFTPQRPSNDFCVNETTVGEYYCDSSRSDGALEEIFCEFGCNNGACKLPPSQVVVVCDQGCPFNGECLPVGTRVNGKYCDFTQVLKSQIEGECNNNHECKSNLCLSGECLSEEGGRNFLKDVENTYFWE